MTAHRGRWSRPGHRCLLLATTVGILTALVVGSTAPAASLAVRRPLLSTDPQVGMAVFTRDGSDVYSVSRTRRGLQVQADARNVGSDTRVVMYRRGVRPVADGESCASWGERRGDIVQMGAALRITRDHGVVRAITVTQNIYVSPFAFNVHTWDTSRPGRPHRVVAQVDMRARFFAFGVVPLPWHFCARAVGDTVAFKVWGAREREPAWGDPSHSEQVTLPDGWDHPGQVGWYTGHLRPGDVVHIDEPSAWTFRERLPLLRRLRSVG